MSNQKPFYITTTLPYVNADPHIGFAMEIIRADSVARYHKGRGEEVFFNTGTDEHGLKVYRKAQEAGLSPEVYVQPYAEKFKSLREPLGLLPELHFIRTTDAHHVYAAQEFWKICYRNGYIYKKTYRVKYCVGCELEKTDSELVNGRCSIHSTTELELIDEENYFFKFSAFGDKLLDLYAERPDLVIPSMRQNEIRAFVSRGLEDFSISRLKEKMPWGVPVPGDEAHVMYVWFDALVNYISAIGWPSNLDTFHRFWVEAGGVVQYCGKDNLRQQAAMWQAMLMSVSLPPSKHIIINGFVLSGGQKMSKSIGNVIDPFAVVREYGTDALRYLVLRELSSFEDGDVTMEKVKEVYNGGLANGIGNLVSRVLKMATTNGVVLGVEEVVSTDDAPYHEAFAAYDIKRAADYVWQYVQNVDVFIQETQPFKVVKGDPVHGKKLIHDLLVRVAHLAVLLVPLLPQTAETIQQHVRGGTMPPALFPRKE